MILILHEARERVEPWIMEEKEGDGGTFVLFGFFAWAVTSRHSHHDVRFALFGPPAPFAIVFKSINMPCLPHTHNFNLQSMERFKNAYSS